MRFSSLIIGGSMSVFFGIAFFFIFHLVIFVFGNAVFGVPVFYLLVIVAYNVADVGNNTKSPVALAKYTAYHTAIVTLMSGGMVIPWRLEAITAMHPLHVVLYILVFAATFFAVMYGVLLAIYKVSAIDIDGY